MICHPSIHIGNFNDIDNLSTTVSCKPLNFEFAEIMPEN